MGKDPTVLLPWCVAYQSLYNRHHYFQLLEIHCKVLHMHFCQLTFGCINKIRRDVASVEFHAFNDF